MLTGATGFIGSHIAEALIQRQAPTHLFVRKRNRRIDLFEEMGAVIHVASPENLVILKESIQGADVIIHCAGATKAVSRSEYFKANVDFTRNILKVIEEHQKLVFLSSQAAAGPSNLHMPIDEKSEPQPVSYYGESKLSAEIHIQQWGISNDNNYLILRPCIVYGPGEKDLFNGFRLIKDNLFIVLGDSNKQFSIIHVTDLVKAVIKCLESPAKGEVFFVCHDETCSWEALGTTIKESFGKSRLLTIEVPEYLAYFAAALCDIFSFATQKPFLVNRQKIIEAKQQAWLCSNKKIKNKLSWKPEIPLEKGIKQTAEWYIQENWI